MINEIIQIYSKQLELYNTIKETLEKLQNSDFDLITYNIEFENADYILNKIEKLNEKAEQLKLIYTAKNNLNDFTGEEIIKIEAPEEYKRLKAIIDDLTSMITVVKLIQDRAINRINSESNINKRAQSSFDRKSAVSTYKSNVKKNKEK